jgi:acetylornithine deacetylase
VRRLQAEVAATGLKDGDYDVPYTTLHVGKMSGGVQVNIVPNHAVLDFEIRSLGGEDVAGLIRRLEAEAEAIVAPLRAEFPEARSGWNGCGTIPVLARRRMPDVVRFRQGPDRGERHDQGRVRHRRRAVRRSGLACPR